MVDSKLIMLGAGGVPRYLVTRGGVMEKYQERIEDAL